MQLTINRLLPADDFFVKKCSNILHIPEKSCNFAAESCKGNGLCHRKRYLKYST